MMTADTDVQGLIRKTQQYEFVDGLRDLQLSIILGLGGVVIWFVFSPWYVRLLQTLIARYGRWAAWSGMIVVVLPALAAWAMLALMRFLRRRWLWVSSGTANPHRIVVPRRVNLIAAALLVVGIGVSVLLRARGIVDDAFVLRALWAATGWSFGYTLYGVGRHIGLPRYLWIGAVGGLASTAILLLPLSFAAAALALGLGWCVVLAASGFICLRQAWARAGRGADVRSD
jgi:hypothetical protein